MGLTLRGRLKENSIFHLHILQTPTKVGDLSKGKQMMNPNKIFPKQSTIQHSSYLDSITKIKIRNEDKEACLQRSKQTTLQDHRKKCLSFCTSGENVCPYVTDTSHFHTMAFGRCIHSLLILMEHTHTLSNSLCPKLFLIATLETTLLYFNYHSVRTYIYLILQPFRNWQLKTTMVCQTPTLPPSPPHTACSSVCFLSPAFIFSHPLVPGRHLIYLLLGLLYLCNITIPQQLFFFFCYCSYSNTLIIYHNCLILEI